MTRHHCDPPVFRGRTSRSLTLLRSEGLLLISGSGFRVYDGLPQANKLIVLTFDRREAGGFAHDIQVMCETSLNRIARLEAQILPKVLTIHVRRC